MAKKTATTNPQLAPIPSISAGEVPLSKAQKEFNRLSKRIVKLEKDVHAFREAATRLRHRVQTEYQPLKAKHNAERAAMVRVLDHAHNTYKLTKGEKAKIADLIGNECADLLQRGHPELAPIIDRYAPPLTADEEKEADRTISEAMKELFTQQFGIEFDPEVDVSTQEKFQAYIDQEMAARQAAFEAQEQEQAARRTQQKKSPKQQAAEAKKLAEEKNITKSVRALYMDLVKTLHPDREPDEAEKLRKTELLKKVTTAYEANELLTLLRLQLELQNIDQSHLENLAEDQLRTYNKLLREQALELDDQLYEEQITLQNFTGQPYYLLSTPAAIEYDYQRQKTQLEYKVRQLAADVLAFEHDPAAVKAFLKGYRIPKGGGPIMMMR